MNIRPAESDVKRFLRAALRQRARAVVSLEVKARAVGLLSEDQHITDARVFKRAKKSLGIKSLRAGFGARSRWLWQLPQLNQEAQEEEAAPQPQLPIDWALSIQVVLSSSGRLAGVDRPQGRGGLLLARISGPITDQDHGLALFGGLCPRDGAFVGLGVLDNVVACGKGRRRQADRERTGEHNFRFHE